MRKLAMNRIAGLVSITAIMISLTQTSCKKTLTDKEYIPVVKASDQSRNPDLNCDLRTTICLDCPLQNEIDNSTTDYPTQLGELYNNPYSIPNMTTAFNYIYSTNQTSVVTTHLYVRFKPADVYKLDVLEKLDLDLFDYPLDREVIEDGDFWPDAYQGLGSNEYPWLYTVVESNFNFPAGIQYEILQALHIPNDNAVLEDEAYYITGNSVCDGIDYTALREERKEYYRLHPIDPCDLGGMDGCPGGCTSGCGGGTPGSGLNPRGQINFATYVSNSGGRVSATAPLKYARIVGRRFLKIDKTYTDQNGNFQFSKRFPRKVTLIVKFKASTGHGQHSVRLNHTNAGFWRSMFPMKKNIGTYRGNNLQDLRYVFEKGTSSVNAKTRKWLAAVIMNTTEEARLLIGENNLITLPNDLRLYLYSPGEQLVNEPKYDFLRRSNAPYLNQDRVLFDNIVGYAASLVAAAVTVSVAVLSVGIAPAIITAAGAAISFSIIPHYPDVYFYYKTEDINSLNATKVSICAGQQIGITYLYNVYENSPFIRQDRASYIGSKLYAVNHFSYNDYAPFGNGIPVPTQNYFPGLIGIWEAYAQHFGHAVSDRIYGIGANSFELQGKTWQSDLTKSSNFKYLEGFEPTILPPHDYFSWIPVGLINDLMDNVTDMSPSTVVDNVSGFTYFEFQSALYFKPSSIPEFKNRLKDIKPAQALQIDQLFASYGY